MANHPRIPDCDIQYIRAPFCCSTRKAGKRLMDRVYVRYLGQAIVRLPVYLTPERACRNAKPGTRFPYCRIGFRVVRGLPAEQCDYLLSSLERMVTVCAMGFPSAAGSSAGTETFTVTCR
jgi:hypothetical protein